MRKGPEEVSSLFGELARDARERKRKADGVTTEAAAAAPAALHVAMVGQQPVRFYRSPLNDGRPDMPWCSISDILFATGYDKTARARLAVTISRDYRERIRSVADPVKARLVIGCYVLAMDVLSAAMRRGFAHGSLIADLRDGCMEAAQKMLADRDPGEAALYLIDAAKRWKPEEKAA
jgi:hypothetical protein